jgi:hypothetical protein
MIITNAWISRLVAKTTQTELTEGGYDSIANHF